MGSDRGKGSVDGDNPDGVNAQCDFRRTWAVVGGRQEEPNTECELTGGCGRE